MAWTEQHGDNRGWPGTETGAGQGETQGTGKESRQQRAQVLALVGWGGEGKVGRELRHWLEGSRKGATAEREWGRLAGQRPGPRPPIIPQTLAPQAPSLHGKGLSRAHSHQL